MGDHGVGGSGRVRKSQTSGYTPVAGTGKKALRKTLREAGKAQSNRGNNLLAPQALGVNEQDLRRAAKGRDGKNSKRNLSAADKAKAEAKLRKRKAKDKGGTSTTASAFTASPVRTNEALFDFHSGKWGSGEEI